MKWLVMVLLLASCATGVDHVAVEVEDDAEWRVAVVEYCTERGYMQYNEIHEGKGAASINLGRPQYVRVEPLSEGTSVEIVNVLRNADRSQPRYYKHYSTGTVAYWRTLERETIESGETWGDVPQEPRQ